jgi:hypothetical protein
MKLIYLQLRHSWLNRMVKRGRRGNWWIFDWQRI